jgi:flavin-binding protein dodecin
VVDSIKMAFDEVVGRRAVTTVHDLNWTKVVT